MAAQRMRAETKKRAPREHYPAPCAGAALLMRHQEPALFRETLERLGGRRERDIQRTELFADGLCGISEMFVRR